MGDARMRRLQFFATAVLAGAAGCAGRQAPRPVACDVACDSPVQRAVTTAWEADRAGNSRQALAGYLEVLAEDPGNKWAAARVEQLSAQMPERTAMVARAEPAPRPESTTWPAEPARPPVERTVERTVAESAGNPFEAAAAAPTPKPPAEAAFVATGNPFDTPAAPTRAAPAGPAVSPFEDGPAADTAVSNVSFNAAGRVRDFRDVAGPADSEVVSLLSDLSSPLPASRSAALEALALKGRAAAAARPAVSLLMNDADDGVRADAAWAAYQISGEAAASVETLTSLLSSPVAATRSKAVQALGLIGAPAAAAVPPLRRLAADEPGVESVRAIEAVARIEPADPAPARMLVDATRFGREAVRAEAVYAMGALPVERSAEVVPALANCLHDDAESVRTAAALTLGHFGGAAEPARRTLEAAARFDTEAVRKAARATLACMP